MAAQEVPTSTTEPCQSVGLAITRAFELLGKRWTGLVVSVLDEHGPSYFSELRRAIPGISERMLSDRLTELADAGLVLRQVDEGPPLRVSYRLTDSGAALRPALGELARWAELHLCPGRPTC
ncbi:winged helix-turn-helix transcriptional regulator [Kitasatospora herbaricolor]|uniref:winged helix-turn-helix transcriptional regulator n=1 Tax=Kitasatospora herbaricolor TaxID=68217 RepID=UPI0036DEAC1E